MMRRPGGPQRPAGLGDVDDAVGDVGDLGLAGAVGQPDVGLDALGREVAAGSSSGYSVDTRTPCGQVLDPLDAAVAGDRHDDLDRVGRRLRVPQLARGSRRRRRSPRPSRAR